MRRGTKRLGGVRRGQALDQPARQPVLRAESSGGNDRIGTLKFTKSGDAGLMTILMTFSAPADKFFRIANPVEVERLVLDNLFD